MKRIEQRAMRVVDPDIYFIEEVELDDEVEDFIEEDDDINEEIRDNVKERSETFSIEEDLILMESILSQMAKYPNRSDKEHWTRCLVLLENLTERRWKEWEDIALLKGVNERLKGHERIAGKQYMQEWWMEWKHEEEGGIWDGNACGQQTLSHRTAQECYQRYLELNFEKERMKK